MKTAGIVAIAVLIAGSGLALHVARAQQPRPARAYSSPPERSTRRGTSAAATRRNSPRMSWRKGSAVALRAGADVEDQRKLSMTLRHQGQGN
jgi:hypothetical protein